MVRTRRDLYSSGSFTHTNQVNNNNNTTRSKKKKEKKTREKVKSIEYEDADPLYRSRISQLEARMRETFMNQYKKKQKVKKVTYH